MKSPARPPRSNLRFALRVIWLLTKGFTLIFIFLLVLAVGAIVAFPQLYDSEKVRQLLVTQLSFILRRPVEIQGVVLSPQGIKLRGVHVYSNLEPDKQLLASDFAVMTLKLRPLLDRRLELSNVRLVNPRIMLWRGEDGVWNITDLLPSAAPAAPVAAGKLALPTTLAAESTVIENGTLEVDDRLRKTSTRIDRFNLTVRRFSFDRPFSLSLSFDNVNRFGGRELKASVAVEGSMSLASQNWSEAYVRAERLEAKIDGRLLRGSAGLSDFAHPSVDADLLAPGLGPSDWQEWLGKPVDLTLPPLRLRARVRRLDARQFKLERVQIQAGPLSATAAGTLDLSGPKPRLEAFATFGELPLDSLAGFRPSLAGLRLKGTASGEAGVSGSSDRLVVHRAKLHLRGFSAVLKNSVIRRGDLDAAASDDFARVWVSASNGSVESFSSAFTDISASLKLAGRDLDLERLDLRWGDSRLRLKAEIKNLAKPKQVTVSGNIDHLQWERAQDLVNTIIDRVSHRPPSPAREEDDASAPPWVQTFKYVIPRKFPDTTGHIRIGRVDHKNFYFNNTDLLWDIKGVTPRLDNVSGDISAGFGPGRVNDIQAVQDSNKFLRIVFLPYIYMQKMNNLSVVSLSRLYPTSLDFDRIEGDYTISQGVVNTHFFRVASPQLLAYADGTADFARERVNMGILTRLTTYREKLPEWWVDEKGRPAIGFRVTGDLNHPDLEPRLRKIGENEIENAVAEGRKRVEARFEVIQKLKTLEEAPVGEKQ